MSPSLEPSERIPSAQFYGTEMEELFQDSPDVIGAANIRFSERVADRMAVGKRTLARLQEKSKGAARKTDLAIRKHPYASLTVILGAGLLIGELIARGRSKIHAGA